MTTRLKNSSLIILLAGAFALFSWQSFGQPRADLTEGTIYLDGSLSVDYEMKGLKDAQHTFKLNSNVGGGYFVIDGWAVGASLPIKWTFSPKSHGTLGLKLLTTYFFDIDNIVYPYIGINATPGFNLGTKEFTVNGGLDTGILVSLSEAVAIDLGIRPNIDFKIAKDDKWTINVPAGFIGVRAFF